MTAEELKQLADLSDEVIKLKAKIIKIRKELLASSLFGENEADESQPSCLGAVISRFNSTVEKQQSFYSELKALLVKYDAELTIEDFGRNWQTDEKIVVDFKYDESFFEKENTGIVPQLVLGRWENGL